MLVVGVAGGIASGKSLVAKQFQELGASVLDADGAGHEVLQEAEVKSKLIERFGERILATDGQQIDRSKLAGIVFGPAPEGPANLTFLEDQTHPRIKLKLRQQIAKLAKNGFRVSILDAAVMFKAGWESICDHIVFVDAPEQLRIERALSRNWTKAEFRSREKSQTTIEDKRRKADFFIDNSGSVEQTCQQVQQIWEKLTS